MFENMDNADRRLSFEEFKETVECIYALNKVSEEYTNDLRKVDSDLAEYMEENSKVELLYRINDKLMTTVFGDMIDDVFWLLYEWKFGMGMGMSFEVNDKKYLINTLEDFFNYIFKVYYTPSLEPSIFPEVEAEVTEERTKEREVFTPVTDGGIVGKIKRMFGL